jgi:hypothetical protein
MDLCIFIYISILLLTFIQSISPIEPESALVIPDICSKNCNSQYGSVIGKANNVTAYSNCNENCINWDDSGVNWTKNLTGLARDVFVGIRWQCVEYARRYFIINFNVAFTSVDYAYQIFNLTEVNDLTTIDKFKEFKSFPNENVSPPHVGDLIIYPKTEQNPVGHVAVISEVDLKAGFVGLAEQNYFNKIWDNFTLYARRIKLINCKGKWVLTNSPWRVVNIQKVFSLNECCNNTEEIIGWKRVLMN